MKSNVTSREIRHSDDGLKGLLRAPWAYSFFLKSVMPPKTFKKYVNEFIQPSPECKILDIGCGPADILEYLPDSIGRYVGFDMNPLYIEAAEKRWGARGEFICQRVDDRFAGIEQFDIVLAFALLHHLSDVETDCLFQLARRMLRPGGVLVTYDPVYVEGQHWFARWLISQDRGQNVRTPEGYRNIAGNHFSKIQEAILFDSLRMPYTHFVMRCAQ